MTTRSTITLGVLILLGFVAVVVLRIADTDERASATVATLPVRSTEGRSPREADASAKAVAAPMKSAATRQTETPPDTGAIGQANGTIHFQRQPNEKTDQVGGQVDGKVDSKGASIDFDVHSALGVWQPGENLMRILLLETAPAAGEVARMLAAIESGSVSGLAKRMAVIELRFAPTAQAFDRNELDSARLIVSDGALTSTADALNSLTWDGSLPSPQLELPAGRDNPQVALSSASERVTADRETWMQSWKLALTVPVVMRK